MPIAGPLTSAQLLKYVDTNEANFQRRSRLFEKFGAPRAALINGLRQEVFNFIITEQDSLRDALVLDYGCGVQPYSMAFQIVGANLIGIDISNNLDAQVHISDKGFLPFADESIDYVVSFQVLEHIPSPSQYLMECNRILKPHGKIFLTTHGVWPYHPTPGDYHRWTKDGLILEIERAGFYVQWTGNVLNESSAALQSFVINFHYKKKFKGYKKMFHWMTNMLICLLERYKYSDIQLPAIITLFGNK